MTQRTRRDAAPCTVAHIATAPAREHRRFPATRSRSAWQPNGERAQQNGVRKHDDRADPDPETTVEVEARTASTHRQSNTRIDR